MCADRIDIPTMLAKLSPKKRVEAEDLVLEAAIRRDNARRSTVVDPIVREHAEACVKAILGDPPMPLSREASEAIRAAWREMGRHILEEEREMAGPEPALATEDDDA